MVRSTLFDAPRILVTVDPVWLLAPLFARDALGLPVTDGDPGRLLDPVPALDLPAVGWSDWWRAALAWRPGGPPPRSEDLGGPAGVDGPLRDWLAARPPTTVDGPEQTALQGIRDRLRPGLLQVLVLPAAGDWRQSPDDRVVVTVGARRAAEYPVWLARVAMNVLGQGSHPR
jgi:hypothetical protein